MSNWERVHYVDGDERCFYQKQAGPLWLTVEPCSGQWQATVTHDDAIVWESDLVDESDIDMAQGWAEHRAVMWATDQLNLVRQAVGE